MLPRLPDPRLADPPRSPDPRARGGGPGRRRTVRTVAAAGRGARARLNARPNRPRADPRHIPFSRRNAAGGPRTPGFRLNPTPTPAPSRKPDRNFTGGNFWDLKDAADTALKVADTAVKAVMDDSEDAKVTAADEKVKAAEKAVMKVPDAERGDLRQRLMDINAMLATRRSGRTAAMKAVHVGIAPYDDVTDNVERRYAVWSDQGLADLQVDATVNVSVGEADAVNLKLDKATMVAALKGWKGARYKLDDEGTTYEAVVYDNRYSAPNDRFNAAWTIQSDGQLNESGTRTGNDKKVNSVTTAGTHRIGGFGEVLTGMRGEHSGVPGTYSCAPAIGYACAVEFKVDGHTPGGATANNNILSGTNYAIWRFRPDNPEQRIKPDADAAFVTYGYWIRKGADGKWDVSAFHNANRGPVTAISGLEGDTKLAGTATYGGGAAGVYALSDGAGTFTADAELVADFRPNSASVPGTNSVPGTIDGFMTRGFTGGDGMPRDWSVELHKLAIGDGGGMAPDTSSGATGLTRWTMDGTAAPAAGKWEGAFYERGGAGQRPKAATGSFYAEHGMSGRMVGAFGVTDPDTDEPLE